MVKNMKQITTVSYGLLNLMLIIIKITRIKCNGINNVKTNPTVMVDTPYYACLKAVDIKTKDVERLCDGVIVAEKTVLSQSICKSLYEEKLDEKGSKFEYFIGVGFGKDKNLNTEMDIKVKDVCRPGSDLSKNINTDNFEEKVKSMIQNSVVLIILEESITFTDKISPMKISDNYPTDGADCHVTGWNSEQQKINTLQTKYKTKCDFETDEIQFLYASHLVCAEILPERIISGPLVCNNLLVAITTNVVDVVPTELRDKIPSQYLKTDITNLYLSALTQREWIEENLNKQSGLINAVCSSNRGLAWYWYVVAILAVVVFFCCFCSIIMCIIKCIIC